MMMMMMMMMMMLLMMKMIKKKKKKKRGRRKKKKKGRHSCFTANLIPSQSAAKIGTIDRESPRGFSEFIFRTVVIP
ncbi:hypothetical protein ElyMa_005319300 [Elysia marginata]|uniref:Secreted protein n=1 Tax=Elysia marginata TaxID=1093978 RepID=A0AAV4K1T8_9GAST|nr:hypothetical protein ElyMa_005319300 [Elysia marginata]